MAKTFNRMRIDVNEKPNSICINPVQNDTQSRYLDVSLYNNGLPIDLTGEVVRINFKKEDGTTFFNQGEITNAAEGRCQFALTNEVLSEAKTLKAQISIWSGEGEILSTQVFTIYVAESIRNDEEVESTNEFGVLVVLFQEIQNSLDLMQTIAENFGEPGEKAAEFEAETFWQMLEVLAQRADTKDMIKEYVNGTVDSGYFHTLDKLMCAQLVCRGYVGTIFTVTDTTGVYEPFIVEIDEDSKITADGDRVEFVSIPLGIYSVLVTVGELEITKSIAIGELGKLYAVEYAVEDARFTSDGTYTPTFPNIRILAVGAGAGGSGPGNNGTAQTADAGNGGGAATPVKKDARVEVGVPISVVIGIGGEGGEQNTSSTSSNPGSNGGSTVVEGIVTAPGGIRDQGGKGGNNDYGIASKGSALNAKEIEELFGAEIPVGEGGRAGGTFETPGSGHTRGGGGGNASIGNGGDGGSPTNEGGFTNEGKDGGIGAGGGGGAYYGTGTKKGGKGGNGMVIFFKYFGRIE